MARDSRTLSLKILADIDDLKKKLDQADGAVEQNSSKISEFGKKAALAFAAVGAAAGAFAISAIKAAAEDEASQVRLQNALRNTVGATDQAINAAERYIAKQSLATGVTDDQLRPALERLTRSTKDIAEAQKLTNLALDIAAAKNLDVTIVANALAKANDGQTTALKKLGITLGDNANNLTEYNKLQKALEKAQLDANFALEEFGPKSKEYINASQKVQDVTQKANEVAMQGIDIFGELGKEFAGAASEAANTFEGQMARLKVGLDEAKESLGAALLPTVQIFISFLNDEAIPILNAFIAGLTGDEGLSASFTEAQKNAESFGKAVIFVADKISGLITFVREAIGLVASLVNEFIRLLNLIPKVNIPFLPNPAPRASDSSLPSVPSGGSNFSYGSGNPTNITINAIDGEGAARAVAKVLNQSAARSAGLLVGGTVGR